MRTAALRPLVVAALLGAAAGSLVALAGHWWARRQQTEFGFYSYSPLPDDRSALISVEQVTNWWQLLWPAVLTGAVVAVLGTIVLTVRRTGRRPLPHGWRGALALAAVGVVLGTAVGATLYQRSGSADEGHPRRYVDYRATSDDGAYDSALSITLAAKPANVAAFLAVCAGVGLSSGLLCGGVLMIARRRRIPDGTAGAA